MGIDQAGEHHHICGIQDYVCLAGQILAGTDLDYTVILNKDATTRDLPTFLVHGYQDMGVFKQ